MSGRDDRIRELYEAALERPIGERAAFVSSHSEGDEDLRLRVNALLTGQQDTALPGYEHGGGASLLVSGTTIGQYRIDGPLGAGGMGVVYRATDLKLNRPAAIKVLPENLADPEARRRFQREAQTASSLNHPHIVTVYDAGEYEGRQYLITEYVDGGTLRLWAARPRGWRAIVELLVGVADAVAVAHEAGILHRDIKPENILLAKNGYAKLADFGLAKLLEGDPLADDAFVGLRPDAQSSLVGTAAYMSPEQAQGLPLDGRSDVYSFGLVLHELLSGRRPDPTRALEQRQGAGPAPIAPLGDGMPAELRALVAKALEHDAADRYQTMRELVVDLRRIVRGPVIETSTAFAKSAPASPARRATYAVAALAAMAALFLGGGYVLQTMRGGGPVQVAVLPFVNETGSSGDAPIAEGVGDTLRDRLMELPGLEVQARSSSVSFRGENVALPTIARNLGVDVLVNGSVRRDGDTLTVVVEVLDNNGFALRPPFRYQRSTRDLQAMQQAIVADVGKLLAPQQEKIVVETLKATTPTVASEGAHVLVLRARYLENQVKEELTVDEAKLKEAIRLYEQAALVDPSSIAAHSHLASALLYGGYVEEAAAPLQKALELGEALDPSSASVDLSNLYYTIAIFQLRIRSRDVEGTYQRAIALNPNNADALGGYAFWLMTHHQADTADPFFREALRLDRRSISRYMDYAEYLGTVERMDDLRALGDEIAAQFPNARGYARLARVYEATGEVDVGIAWGLRALREQPDDEEIQRQVAELYARIGMKDEAIALDPDEGSGLLWLQRRYDDLIERASEDVLNRPTDLMARYLLAFGYNAVGEYESARSLLESLGLADFERDSIDPREPQWAASLADALQGLGAYEEARSVMDYWDQHMRLSLTRSMEKSWWVNTLVACADLQYAREAAVRGDTATERNRRAGALATLDDVRAAEGLPFSPLLLDSPCFEPLANEPTYLRLVEHLEQRQLELQARLPVTLREYGVEDVLAARIRTGASGSR